MRSARSFKRFNIEPALSSVLHGTMPARGVGILRTKLARGTGQSGSAQLQKFLQTPIQTISPRYSHFGDINRATMSTRSGIFSTAPVQVNVDAREVP